MRNGEWVGAVAMLLALVLAAVMGYLYAAGTVPPCP